MKQVLITVCMLGLVCCIEKPRQIHVMAGKPAAVDSISGTAPFLTRNHSGNLVLSWVRSEHDSSAVFCYSISKDGGKSFAAPVIIPSSSNIQAHSENIPKVIFKPSGEILAVWGVGNPTPKNKYSGLVNYSQSFDGGNSWTPATPLVTDSSSFDQRYSDVALLPNGEVAIIWLDNRVTTAKDGAALYFATTNGRNGFSKEKLVSQPSCECCRTDLFVDKKGNIHVLYRGIIQDSIRDMVHAVSTDGGGSSFSKPQQINDDHWVLNGCPHTGPAMAENDEGLHFAWFTGGGKTGSFYTRTTNNGKSFTGYDSISHLGRHPQLASFASGELIIAWDEVVTYGNKLNKRVGVQIRSAEGRNVTTSFITPDSEFASYPVIATLDKSASVIAYCKKESGRTLVMYQRIMLN